MLDVLPWRINTGANKAGYTHSGDGNLCQTSMLSLQRVAISAEDAAGVW